MGIDQYINKIICGDALEIIRSLPDGIVNCCVTSPPYWGLRDYGVDGQLGLERTPEEYIAKMVGVFREVRRILRDDGTLWLNMGDCYATDGGIGTQGKTGCRADRRHTQQTLKKRITKPLLDGSGKTQDHALRADEAGRVTPNLKPKDLVGMPWRLALALQADGWYLRSDIIWHKPCPMPESVNDRPTKAHEYLFLLSKSERYHYDHEAIMEQASPDTHARYARGRSDDHKWADGGPGNQTIAKSFVHMRAPGVNPKAMMPKDEGRQEQGLETASKFGHGPGWRNKQNESFSAAVKDVVEWRNKRTVWTVPPQPFPEAHFATFPEALVRPCILAGCPEGGLVFDPFIGSGTVAVVAESLGCNWLGIELNPAYIEMAERRIAGSNRQNRIFVR